MGRAGEAEEGGEEGEEGEEEGAVGGQGGRVGDKGDICLGGGEEEARSKGVKVGGGLHSKHLPFKQSFSPLPFTCETSEIYV